MKYFGTDGFRGLVNVDLTVEHALKIGQFLGYYFTKQKGSPAKCVIGKDTRRSSYMYEYGVAAGVTSSGADAYLMHVTTTPSVSYITKAEDFDFGIMITASHNPYKDNGIKIVKNGFKIELNKYSNIDEYIQSLAFVISALTDKGFSIDDYDIPLLNTQNSLKQMIKEYSNLYDFS